MTRYPRDYECWIGPRLVRTFNAQDLAEDYQSRMAALGSSVEIRVVRAVRRAA